jgi:hypothetical protein
VVVDAGHRLELEAVGQPDAAHDVHLPQLHWPGSLPASVVGLATPAGAGLDEPVAQQRTVDAGEPWRVDAGPGQFVGQPALAPVGMPSAQLAQVGLDLGGHLVGAAARPVRPVGKRPQAAGLVAA